MSADFESLRKILELEQKKGYDNTAVIGGLDRFLKKWAGQAAEAIPDRRFMQRFQQLVTKVDYVRCYTTYPGIYTSPVHIGDEAVLVE